MEYINVEEILENLKPGETLLILQKNENEHYTFKAEIKAGCNRLENLTKSELIEFYNSDSNKIRNLNLLPAEVISLKKLIENQKIV